MRVNNFLFSESVLTIFFHTTCREPGVITWVQFVEGLPPKIESRTGHSRSYILAAIESPCPILCRPSIITFTLSLTVSEILPLLHRVSRKLCKLIFCHNFVKFRPIMEIFGIKIAKRGTRFSDVYLFSTSPNLCQRTTVLNADVPNCYITL